MLQWSNPAVHHLKFSSIIQSDNGPIKDFVICLKSSVPDCEFACLQCNYNLQGIHLKYQLIAGINNESLQTDIHAEANHLKILEDIIKHAVAFEAALHDQSSLKEQNSQLPVIIDVNNNLTQTSNTRHRHKAMFWVW